MSLSFQPHPFRPGLIFYYWRLLFFSYHHVMWFPSFLGTKIKYRPFNAWCWLLAVDCKCCCFSSQFDVVVILSANIINHSSPILRKGTPASFDNIDYGILLSSMMSFSAVLTNK